MKNIFPDIKEKGYRLVFSINKWKLHNYYPGVINTYSECFSGNPEYQEDCDKVCETVKSIHDDRVMSEITTILPEDIFPFFTGDSIELLEDQILIHIPTGGYFEDRTVN